MTILLILALLFATLFAGYAKDTNRKLKLKEIRGANTRVIKEYDRICSYEPEKIIKP